MTNIFKIITLHYIPITYKTVIKKKRRKKEKGKEKHCHGW